ncbi:unnamed protein product [Camellia sinensis]
MCGFLMGLMLDVLPVAPFGYIIVYMLSNSGLASCDKYRYELQKKKREQQKKSIANRVDLKELKMGYNIDVRLKAARKFLNDGDKVKIIVNLKGRENEFRNNTSELIKCFQNDVGENSS